MTTDEIVGLFILVFFGGPVLVTLLVWISYAFLGLGAGTQKLISQETKRSENIASNSRSDSDSTSQYGLTFVAGSFALGIAVLAFIASAAVGGGGSLAGSLLAGAMNPLFFIGGPLGLYWLRKSASPHTPADQWRDQPEDQIGALEDQPEELQDQLWESPVVHDTDSDDRQDKVSDSHADNVNKTAMRLAAISDAIIHDDQPSTPSGASGVTDESVHADVADPSANTSYEDDLSSNTDTRMTAVDHQHKLKQPQTTPSTSSSDWSPVIIVLIVVFGFLGIVLFVAALPSEREYATAPTREPEPDPETVMFNLVTDEAAYFILKHVDRPFDLEFGKPIISLPPEDPTIATVLVQCAYTDAGVEKNDLFMVLLENTAAPAYASSKEQLNCLLVNAGGTVLSRDDDYWDGFSLDFQRRAGAIDTGTPPFMAKTMWEFQTSANGRLTVADSQVTAHKEPVDLSKRMKDAPDPHPLAAKTGGDERLWRDVSGRYSVRAALVDYTATTVTLLKQDGNEIVVELSKLCDEDRSFLKFYAAEVEFGVDTATEPARVK